VGLEVSLRARTAEWMAALDKALQAEFQDRIRGSGLKLVSDNGSQPTSRAFMREMAVLGVEQIFTSYDNPKGNADTERVIRTIKEELIWLNEFRSLDEAREMIEDWITNCYNRLYVHSALGYLSPEEYELKYYMEQKRNVA
jgi:transposase InsO family protein